MSRSEQKALQRGLWILCGAVVLCYGIIVAMWALGYVLGA